jgi:hypothetical protein
MKPCNVLSPTAILGYGFPAESFEAGLARDPDVVGVDAGSTDPGPYYLGSGKSFTDPAAVRRDLTLMLTGAVKAGIPLIIGSAGGSGAAPHLAGCLEIVRAIAAEEGLHFRLGVIPADIDKETVRAAVAAGRTQPAGPLPPLTAETVDEAVRIVAQMGHEPIVEALDAGCDVVLCGRAYDPAVFAALPVRAGFARGPALHMGKILECAAIAAEPGSGADCVLGTLDEDGFTLEALSAERRFTKRSTAAHSLYEKADPYHLAGPGGTIDLTGCAFEEVGGGRVRVTGSRFVPSDRYWVKLEGVRRAGFRTICVAGTHDPIMIRGIEDILAEVQRRVTRELSSQGIAARIGFRVYGRNGVMGDLEPTPAAGRNELGIVIEAIAPTQAEADTACSLTRSTLLHYGYEGRISTAGNLAFPFSPSDASMGAVYEFSIYHLMAVEGHGPFAVETMDL